MDISHHARFQARLRCFGHQAHKAGERIFVVEPADGQLAEVELAGGRNNVDALKRQLAELGIGKIRHRKPAKRKVTMLRRRFRVVRCGGRSEIRVDIGDQKTLEGWGLHDRKHVRRRFGARIAGELCEQQLKAFDVVFKADILERVFADAELAVGRRHRDTLDRRFRELEIRKAGDADPGNRHLNGRLCVIRVAPNGPFEVAHLHASNRERSVNIEHGAHKGHHRLEFFRRRLFARFLGSGQVFHQITEWDGHRPAPDVASRHAANGKLAVRDFDGVAVDRNALIDQAQRRVRVSCFLRHHGNQGDDVNVGAGHAPDGHVHGLAGQEFAGYVA